MEHFAGENRLIVKRTWTPETRLSYEFENEDRVLRYEKQLQYDHAKITSNTLEVQPTELERSKPQNAKSKKKESSREKNIMYADGRNKHRSRMTGQLDEALLETGNWIAGMQWYQLHGSKIDKMTEISIINSRWSDNTDLDKGCFKVLCRSSFFFC